MPDKIITSRGSKYSEAIKREAVYQYLLKGNTSLVSRELGIPETTLGQWYRSDWYEPVAAELRAEIGDEIRSQMLEVVMTGTRAAVAKMDTANASQAMTAAAIAFDKIRLLDNQPTTISTNDNKGLQSQLEQLSDKLDKQARINDARIVSDQ